MALTIITSKIILEKSQNEPIFIMATDHIYKKSEEDMSHFSDDSDDGIPSRKLKSIRRRSRRNTFSTGPQPPPTEEFLNQPNLRLDPEVSFAIFFDDELVGKFQEIKQLDHHMSTPRTPAHLPKQKAAEDIFDGINSTLMISEGPTILNDILYRLWAKPLGKTKRCYILSKEEFTACFLSWLEISENHGKRRRTFNDSSAEGPDDAADSTDNEGLKLKRCHVRMPIGRKCVSESSMNV